MVSSYQAEKRMLSHQPFTPLFAGWSSQGAFFSAIMFLWRVMATVTTWHPSHSKRHEAGFVLANERSPWCWTCSISDWATHPGSQHWSARDASSLQPHFTQFHLVCSGHRPHSSPSKATIELYSSKNTKQPHGWNLPGAARCLHLEKGSAPAHDGLLLFLPSHNLWSLFWDWPDGNQSFIVVSSTEAGVTWIQEQITGMYQGGIWSERKRLHMFTIELIISSPFYTTWTSFCFPEVVLPLGLVRLEVQARGSPIYCIHLAFCFCCVGSIPLWDESGALVISHPIETWAEAFHEEIYKNVSHPVL